MKFKPFFFLLSFTLLFVLAGCGITEPSAVVVDKPDQPVTEATEPNEPAEMASCLEPEVGTTLFTNMEDGYCVLLPDGYAVDDSLVDAAGNAETAVYVDSMQESAHARLFVTVADANGRTLDEIAAVHLEELQAAVPDYEISWSDDAMLDGQPLIRFDQVIGQELSRQLLTVHNGQLLTFTFTPDDPAVGDAYGEMELLYSTVVGSFKFLWTSEP